MSEGPPKINGAEDNTLESEIERLKILFERETDDVLRDEIKRDIEMYESQVEGMKAYGDGTSEDREAYLNKFERNIDSEVEVDTENFDPFEGEVVAGVCDPEEKAEALDGMGEAIEGMRIYKMELEQSLDDVSDESERNKIEEEISALAEEIDIGSEFLKDALPEEEQINKVILPNLDNLAE